METLKIEKSTARKLYSEVPKWFQEVLSDNFGKDFFSKKITDQVKTFDDALILCTDKGLLKAYSDAVNCYFPDHIFNFIRIEIVANVLNEGWEPNWNDSNEYKWWPYFQWSSGSGFGFSDSIYLCAYTDTVVGSRLCFKSKELAQYAGSQFIELYRDFLTIKK